MIRIHGKRVLAVLAFLMAIYVFFQLGLIRSTRSSFSDIVREQPDVENHVRQTPLRELKMNYTTTPTSQIKYKSFLITRRSCMQHYDLLIIISSAPSNFGRRNNIRKTWAFERSAKPRWTSVFLVAQTRNEAVSNVLLDEDEALKDLVRASYYDHYWNQTRKIQMGFEWAVTYCNFSFLLKLDDDVFVHVPRVLSFLSAHTTPKKMFYAGNHYTNPVPLREGKWKVTYEEYITRQDIQTFAPVLDTFYLTMLYVHLLTLSLLCRSSNWTMFTLACWRVRTELVSQTMWALKYGIHPSMYVFQQRIL